MQPFDVLATHGKEEVEEEECVLDALDAGLHGSRCEASLRRGCRHTA